jgi:polysaccharide export outer membrane protein
MKAMRVFGMAAMLIAIQLSPAPAVAAQADGQTVSRPVAATAATRRPDYALGAGDKLRITVFGEEDLTGEYAVTGNGTIAFPLIGDIAAVGHTLADVQEAIRAKLASGYIKDPRVAVEVLEYRTFYILGEVNKPGEYPYRANLTLDQAVATAGGYTYRANRKRFDITHAADSTDSRMLFRDARALRVEPGDTIRILERFF